MQSVGQSRSVIDMMYDGNVTISANPRAENLKFLDIAKGIGIFLVVYGHVVRGLAPAGVIDLAGAYGALDAIIYSFHMPLFFMIGGYLSAHTTNRRPLKERFLRLVYYVGFAYLFWRTALVTTKFLVFQVAPGSMNTPVELIDIITIYKTELHLWFLAAYFIAASVVMAVRRPYQLYLVIIAAFVWRLFELPGNGQYINSIFFFALGSAFYIEGRLLSHSGPYYVAFLVIGFSVLSAVSLNSASNYFLFITIAILGSLATLGISQQLAKRENHLTEFLLLLGRNSFCIYILHIFAEAVPRYFFISLFEYTNAVVHISTGLAFGIVFPLIAAHVINRYSLNKWLFIKG